MKPSETADAVERTVRACRSRFENEGAQQYYHPDTGRQDFEDMAPEKLVQWTREEAYDLINYVQMLLVRIDRFEAALADLATRARDVPCGATD
jgi:hypothetical protein